MSSEGQFWYRIWRVVLICLTFLICSGMFYYNQKHRMMTEMIARGADPVKVMCAFDGGGERDMILCAGYLKNGN